MESILHRDEYEVIIDKLQSTIAEDLVPQGKRSDS